MSITAVHPPRLHALDVGSLPCSPGATTRTAPTPGPRLVPEGDSTEQEVFRPLGSPPASSRRSGGEPSSRQGASASPCDRERSLRLTARGRLAVVLLVALAALLAAIAVSALPGARGDASPPMQPVAVRQVTVLPGQTLWSIAADSEPSGDIRERIVEIRTLNGMRSSSLVAGQQLLVPLG